MASILVGNTQTLFRQSGDVISTFDSGLRMMSRVYFCAETYATEAESILIEGYEAEDKPGFNLHPTPTKSTPAPGIAEYECTFYTGTTLAEPKVIRTSVLDTFELVGASRGTVEETASFKVLCDVLTYHYAIPSAQRFRPSSSPAITVDNFTFLDDDATYTINGLERVLPDTDESSLERLVGKSWRSTGTILFKFSLEDVTEKQFGKWKEVSVTWRAKLFQKYHPSPFLVLA